jgi:hypothetical protein
MAAKRKPAKKQKEPTDLFLLGRMLGLCLSSTVEENKSGTPANVVDGLFAIARAIEKVADVFDTSVYDDDSRTTLAGAVVRLAIAAEDISQQMSDSSNAPEDEPSEPPRLVPAEPKPEQSEV